MASITAIEGVGPGKQRKLAAAGVDTVRERGRRNPENLAAAMAEANESGRNWICKRPPSARMVTKWVARANQLDPAVSH